MPSPRRRTAVLLLGLASLSCTGLVAPPETGRPLDPGTIVAGLKEALRVGSERAVDRTAKLDGFLADEFLRIAIPGELERMADALRRIGFDRQVDELEIAMNRAAEQAAGEARDVLWREIRELTIPEALGILRGGPTAATDHFRAEAETDLRARFHPIVVAKMEQVGLSRLYGRLADRYNQLPFATRPALDLDAYVTAKALDGLFHVLGQEEARIREDPLARTTELLRRVFGHVLAEA